MAAGRRRIMSNSFLSIPRITRFVITKLFLPDQINYVASQRIQRVFQVYSMYHKSSSTSCLIRSMIHTFKSRITVREFKNLTLVDNWWPINRWTTLLIRCRWFQGRRNPIDGKRKFLLSLIPSFSFWDKEGIDDEEIKETIQEFWRIKSKTHRDEKNEKRYHDGKNEERHRDGKNEKRYHDGKNEERYYDEKNERSGSRTRSDSIRYEEMGMRREEGSDDATGSRCSPSGNRLGSRDERGVVRGDSNSDRNGRGKREETRGSRKESWNEVQGTDVEDDRDHKEEWEAIILKPNYQVWRRFIPNNSSVYQYKIFGSYDDIPATCFFSVQMDLEYRKTWDKLVVKLDIVDEEERVKRVQSSSSTKQPSQHHGQEPSQHHGQEPSQHHGQEPSQHHGQRTEYEPSQHHGQRIEYERRQRPGKTVQRKKSGGRYRLDDEEFDSGNQVIHWVMHYPFPMYQRDYCYIRRGILDRSNQLMVLISRSVHHPKCRNEENHSSVRVDTYESKMVIRAKNASLSDPGFDYLLTYYDDPRAAIPSPAYNWMAKAGAPDFADKLHSAAAQLYRKDQKMRKEEGEKKKRKENVQKLSVGNRKSGNDDDDDDDGKKSKSSGLKQSSLINESTNQKSSDQTVLTDSSPSSKRHETTTTSTASPSSPSSSSNASSTSSSSSPRSSYFSWSSFFKQN